MTPAARPNAACAVQGFCAIMALLALMIWVAVPARAQVNAPGGVAVGGYDPVAYFTDGRAVPGDVGMALKWHGRMWRFASAANRSTFEANPRAYAPQFGGFCTVGLSEGRIEPGSPTEFVIHDSRLYLVHDAGRKIELVQSLQARLQMAASHWPELRKGLERR